MQWMVRLIWRILPTYSVSLSLDRSLTNLINRFYKISFQSERTQKSFTYYMYIYIHERIYIPAHVRRRRSQINTPPPSSSAAAAKRRTRTRSVAADATAELTYGRVTAARRPYCYAPPLPPPYRGPTSAAGSRAGSGVRHVTEELDDGRAAARGRRLPAEGGGPTRPEKNQRSLPPDGGNIMGRKYNKIW